ncbi:hypothetical protein [Vulgatibacter sp.]|uniref:hypothetical protein n=1 Tax=Vulgatibacter sp. TaxID=1971226 RepID=UPI003561501D
MSREHNIELSSTDKAALCMIFVDGRIAVVSHGAASTTVRTGQEVRWMVRPRRRNAGFAVIDSFRGEATLLVEGRCDPVVTIGEPVLVRASRTRRGTAAAETPRARRVTAARSTATPKRAAAPRAAAASRRRNG